MLSFELRSNLVKYPQLPQTRGNFFSKSNIKPQQLLV